MRRQITVIAVAVVAVVAIALGARHLLGTKAGLPAVGAVIPAAQRPAVPEVSGTTLTGTRLNLTSLRGEPVVINFWGSWCAPCQAEAPVLAQVARDTRRFGVHFVGIDVRDNSSAGLAFEQGHHVPFPSISDSGNLIAARFGSAAPTATPSTYILDTRGRIAWAYFGRTTFSQLEPAVLQVAGS